MSTPGPAAPPAIGVGTARQPSSRGDRGRAFVDQRPAGAEERLQLRRGAHLEIEGRRVAHIAGEAREARTAHSHAKHFHNDVAARAAWSYIPDIVRNSRAISPMSALRSTFLGETRCDDNTMPRERAFRFASVFAVTGASFKSRPFKTLMIY